MAEMEQHEEPGMQLAAMCLKLAAVEAQAKASEEKLLQEVINT
jgi:hypothetical protein